MQLLKEIFDKPIENQNVRTREAARAIIFDKNWLIPMLFVSKHNYHKIPGGWIENSENIQEALAREILEETGCNAEIGQEIGKIIEYRSERNQLQTSYCYFAKVTKKWNPDFTEKELDQWFQIQRMSLDEAISSIINDKPESYEGTFIQPRDLAFLEKAREILNVKL